MIRKWLKISLVIMLLLVLFSGTILLSGCSKKATAPNIEEPAKPITESVADLINKSKEITSIKYELVVSIPNQPTYTQKVWIKGMKQRIEFLAEVGIIVYLIDYEKQVSYNYTPETNTAMKIDMGDAVKSAGETLLDTTETVNIDSKIIGSEVFDGKECTIIEHGGIGTGSVKMWIWKARGLPIKMETRHPDGLLTITEYKNIDFSDIPDEIFELPEDVHIFELPKIMP